MERWQLKMDNFNLWEFSLDIFNKISVVATKIWRLLTTTINDVVGDEEITTGSAIIDTIIDTLFKLIGNYNLLTLFVTLTIIFLVLKVIRFFIGG